MSSDDISTTVQAPGAANQRPEDGKAPERPAIWGGRFPENCLRTFLDAWQGDAQSRPWRICEWVSDLRMEYGVQTLPGHPEWLEQARFFGLGGDLALRRDRAWWLWRFVGPAGRGAPTVTCPEDEVPAGEAERKPGFEVADYWDGRGWDGLTAEPRSVLLWGVKHGPAGTGPEAIFWQEDRVAHAHDRLRYEGPWGEHRPDRVQLDYWTFLNDGNVEAVWWRGLAPAGGAR